MSCQCFNQHSAPPGPKPAKCFFPLPPENAVTLIFSCLTPPARQPPAKHQILRTPPSVTTQLRCLSDLEDASHWPISLSMAACVPFGMPCALHLYGDIRSLPSPPLSPQLMEIASLDRHSPRIHPAGPVNICGMTGHVDVYFQARSALHWLTFS